MKHFVEKDESNFGFNYAHVSIYLLHSTLNKQFEYKKRIACLLSFAVCYYNIADGILTHIA